MVINFIAVFFVPWILGAWLYRKNATLVLTIAPMFSVLSFIVDQWGTYYGYWLIKPVLEDKSVSTLPFNIGIYPVIACSLVYAFNTTKLAWYIWVLIFTAGTTLLEAIGYYFGRVMYGNGWNFMWTFISYLIPYLLTYVYYRFLRRKGLT